MLEWLEHLTETHGRGIWILCCDERHRVIKDGVWIATYWFRPDAERITELVRAARENMPTTVHIVNFRSPPQRKTT